MDSLREENRCGARLAKTVSAWDYAHWVSAYHRQHCSYRHPFANTDILSTYGSL